MNNLQAGANIVLGNRPIEAVITWQAQNISLDVCAFVLNANDKVRFDEDFIFYNQKQSKEGFIKLQIAGDKQSFHIDLNKIPYGVEKILIAVTTEISLASVSNLKIEIQDIAVFSTKPENMQSLILGEIYLRNQQWKFRALGQGFKQGLEFLAEHYGVSVNDSEPVKELAPTTETKPSVIPQADANFNSHSLTQEQSHSVNHFQTETHPPEQSHHKLTTKEAAIKMFKELSWNWVFSSLGIFILVELFLGIFVGQMVSGKFISHVLSYKIEALLILVSYFFGGAVIGLISPKVRIIEPALGAFLSVLLTLSISFFSPYSFMKFTWAKVIVGGGLAFFLALFGARLGEKLSAKMGNEYSQEFFGDEE